MFVAASSPPTLIATSVSGNRIGGITIAGWRSVCRIERRAIWPTWPSVFTRAPTSACSPVPSSSPASSLRPVLARNTSSSVGAWSWKSFIAMSSASSARTTPASASAPPLRRTAAAPGGAGAGVPKRASTRLDGAALVRARRA